MWSTVGRLRRLGALTACTLLAVTLVACTVAVDESSTGDERVVALESQVRALEETVAALASENAALRGDLAILSESLDEQAARLQELETTAAKMESILPLLEEWTKEKDGKAQQPNGTEVERTARLAEEAGGQVYYLEHRRAQ